MKKSIERNLGKEHLTINITTDRNYFSITGEIRSRKGGRVHTCGCIHNEILEIAPELKPIVDLHLSNLDGIPMYDIENGFYYLKKCETQVLADHLRIDLEEANKLKNLVMSSGKADKAVFNKYVVDQYPRWKLEVENALKQIERIK